MSRSLLSVLSILGASSALQLPFSLDRAAARTQHQLGRREAVGAAAIAAAAALATSHVPAAVAGGESKEAKEVRAAAEAMRTFINSKDAFVQGLVSNDPTAPQLPKSVPFAVFQQLEKSAGPEFMETAIDYSEAMRNARELVKLARLTKQKVKVSTKEPGKPRVDVEMDYGDAEGSGLAPTKEYADRAYQEVIGASVVLDAALEFLPKK